MSKTERADYVRVDLSSRNSFGMTFMAPDKNRSLFVEGPEGFGSGTPKEAQDLLRTVMLAHLIAKHFPKVIETNFEVGSKVFLDELYKHYGFGKPRVIKNRETVDPRIIDGAAKREKAAYANAHSGGLDSVYRALKFLSQDKKILVSHLRNLNPKGNYREVQATRKQAKLLSLPYEEITLRNGTDNTGFSAMRTRDFLLALATVVVSAPYGAKKVLIEGDMQTDPSSHFSEYGPAWLFFNRLIKDVGLFSQVEGMDAHDVETIGEIIRLQKKLGVDILPLVQNCFTGAYQIGSSRRKWERETPKIAENSPLHWCGSCLKCRRMTLGRLVYRDPVFDGVTDGEVRYFVDDTLKWMKDYPSNRDLISENFKNHLDRLSRGGV